MPLKMYETQNSPQKPKNILAIAAGKGGVGKSTVTVNLARALQKLGYSVGILDADLYGPSIRKMLPEDQIPSQKGSYIIPALCSGIKMISMAYFKKSHEAAVIRAPIANNIILQFINQVDWGPLDYLLIDFPPGTGDIQLTLSQKSHLTGAIMVTTPQEVAVMDVRKAIYLFQQVKVPILGIVENMGYYYHAKTDETIYLFGKDGGKQLANDVNVPFLGSIPIDPELCQSLDQGKSFFSNSSASNKTVQAFLTLANILNCIILENSSSSNSSLLSIKQLFQNDKHSITIIWQDDKKTDHRLSNLQKHCPCAKCVEESTGKRLLDPSLIDENVEAVQISSVGRYALRIQFSSGCSLGIYSYDMLRP